MAYKKRPSKEDNEDKVYCSACGKTKTIRNFYTSKQKIHDNDLYHNRYPVCKDCIREFVYRKDTGQIDKDKFKEMLQKIDLPFKNEIYLKALNDDKETFGIYIRLLNIFYKGITEQMTWVNSDFEEKITSKVNTNIVFSSDKDFIVSQEIIDKWGEGYTSEEYRAFEKKWMKLIDNYGEKTSFHTENLIIYIRFRVKEEMSTARGEVKEAKEWGALADKSAQNAKINVSQLSKSDISGGVDLICQIFEACETEVGIIPLLPKLLEQPYDDADMIIWANINYSRRLEDKPRVSYREIWGFYDEMLQEYFTQQGFNDNQIKEFKKKRNNVFRDLEEVYKESVYDERE